jgi:phosphate transport system substrate-binding protein
MGEKEHVTFKANVFEDNYSLGNYVSKNRNAIGYLNATVANKIKANIISINGINPTLESISNSQYPICQELRLLTRNNSNEQVKHFISYCLASDKGQAIIRKMGIATPKLRYE